MQKVRKLSFLGILSVCMVVVFLAGISLMPAQVQIQKKPENPGKPDKPSEGKATWAVRIPIKNSGNMLYGMDPDGYYKDGSSIEVKVEKNDFSFVLTNENLGSPLSENVGFQDVNVQNWIDTVYPDEGKPCCQFPDDLLCAGGDCISPDCGGPGCMADFLNGTHPHPDYESFYIYVWITSDIDIESMMPGVYGFGSACAPGGNGDYFIMVARYRDKCTANPSYHDIEFFRNINYEALWEKGEPMNIAIERLNEASYESEYGIGSDGVWRIWVLDYDLLHRPFPESLSLPENINLKVQERYCVRDKGRATWYYPMATKGSFDFYIDFIKNPITQ